jgi:hypothetical protein
MIIVKAARLDRRGAGMAGGAADSGGTQVQRREDFA